MKKKILTALTLMLITAMMVACGGKTSNQETENSTSSEVLTEEQSEETETIEEINKVENSEITENIESTESTEKTPTESETVPESTPEPTPSEPETPTEEITYTDELYDEVSECYIRIAVELRSVPNESGTVLANIPVYAKVQRLGFCRENSWPIIIYNGIRGYVPSFINNEIVVSSAEPAYGSFYHTSGTIETVRESGGWQYEGGRKYWVWVADETEENGGHWDEKYEFCAGNTCSEEVFIEQINKYYDEYELNYPHDVYGKRYYGQYDGEKIEEIDEFNGRYIIFVIYLGGGPAK